MLLFEEEPLLFDPYFTKTSRYEGQGYLDKKGREAYLSCGPLNPTRYTDLCGPYKVCLQELQTSVNTIVDKSLSDGCEYGSLILSKTLQPGLIKDISFFGCVGGISPGRMNSSVLKNYPGYKIGILHSHPTEDFPSPPDFTTSRKVLVGIILPNEKRLIFYKIKAPLFDDFMGEYASFWMRSSTEPWKDDLKKFCLSEEVPLDPNYQICVPNAR